MDAMDAFELANSCAPDKTGPFNQKRAERALGAVLKRVKKTSKQNQFSLFIYLNYKNWFSGLRYLRREAEREWVMTKLRELGYVVRYKITRWIGGGSSPTVVVDWSEAQDRLTRTIRSADYIHNQQHVIWKLISRKMNLPKSYLYNSWLPKKCYK